jgi:hypothetical protein
MSCILIRWTYDPAISSGDIALFVFSVLAPWWPSQESDRTETWSGRSIALAVTKRAVLVGDDNDGQHVIVKSHLRLR